MSNRVLGWAAVQLKQVCDLVNGRAYKQAELLDHGRYPVLRVGNFFSNRNWYYSDLELEEKKYCDTGDLLYAWSASFGPKIWNGGKVIYHYHIWKVLLNEGAIAKRFLYYWFSWDKENIKADHGTGSTMIHVTKADMERRIIHLPPLPEQRRIAAKLDSLTDRTARARAELERIPFLLSRYREILLERLFSGDLAEDFRNEQGLPTPKFVRLGDVADSLDYGTSSKSSKAGRVPVLRMGNIQNGLLDWDDLVYSDDDHEIAKYRLKAGDVLFNRTNSPELVGKTAMFDGSREAIFAGYLIRIRCGGRVLPDYLTYCLNSPGGRQFCWRVKSDGVSQSNINATKLANFEFSLPDVREQEEALKRLRVSLKWLDRVSSEHDGATHLIPRLEQEVLARAFQGGLVQEDPKEAASVLLLERIETITQHSLPIQRRGRRAELLEATEAAAPPYVSGGVRTARNGGHHFYVESDRSELMCRIRRVFSAGGQRDREEAIRELAHDLGAERVGSRIREELENGIRTAVRRGILDAEGSELRLNARSIEEYNRDFVKDQFLASLQGRVWTERETALVQFARWMGYGRTGPAIEDMVRSLINGLLRNGRLEAEGTRIRKA